MYVATKAFVIVIKQFIVMHQRMFYMVIGLVFTVMGFMYLGFYVSIRIGFLIIINLVFTKTNSYFTR